MSIISIIGSGGMAAAIAGLAAKAGHTLEVVSRDPVKARALVEQVGGGATTGTYDAAPVGDIVILAVPYSAVLDVVKQYGEKLRSEESRVGKECASKCRYRWSADLEKTKRRELTREG